MTAPRNNVVALRARLGLTLVEVALVGGVIGLLTAVLLPALGTAREQARVRQCLANMRVIGAASNAYLTEFNSLSFALPQPYSAAGSSYSWSYTTEYIPAGGMPDKTSAAMQLAGLPTSFVGADVYRIPPKRRPLNQYLEAGVPWSRSLADRNRIPAVIPGIFRCPSDDLFHSANAGSNQLQEFEVRTWEWFGTSYAINWWWPYYYPPIPGAFDGLIVTHGSLLLREYHGPFASELVLFMENPLNASLAGARPQGYSGGPWSLPQQQLDSWHGRFSRHTAAFRDGSARHQFFDSRFVEGDGWTMWPRKPWAAPWDAYDGMEP